MRKLIANEWMTLDGVVQAPGQPDEDTSGGFEHGGWHVAYFDYLSQQRVVENLREASAFLLGRRTYEGFASYWPNASEEEQVLAEPLNTKPKYVASTTLTEPLDWQNSTLLQGDVADAVGRLKADEGGESTLSAARGWCRRWSRRILVDEFRFMIDPIFVGGGKRIFPDYGVLRPMQLVGSEVTSTGAILATFARSRG